MRTCPQCNEQCDETHKFCPACGFPIAKVAMSTEDALLGRTLPGGYVILELVGIGGMGRVYRAEQTNLGRTVAVKIIHPHLVGEENAAARFITEARAASRLNHPNSVAVIDFGKTSDGQLYLVMEFLRGSDLARVAYEEGPLAFRRVVNVLRQVLAALSEAHALGIIHRDLKPENVILEPTRSGGDFVKVVDFGLAKMREVEVSKPSITSPGIVCGTPEYMSPEQGRGDPLDGQSDLYSVGVVLYQLLTGKLPFEGDSPTQVVLMHLTQSPRDPREVAPERRIPDPIVDVCMRALEKDARDRFKDADEFAECLQQALADVEGDRASVRVAAASAIKCAACGALNGVGQKFCGECGASLLHLRASSPSVAPPSTDDERTLPGLQQSGNKPVPSARGVMRLPLPVIGREDDLAWLEERRLDAKAALGGARLVGDAGIGKTRVLREFLRSCTQSGDVVVEAGPDPAWAEVGYYALRTAIRRLVGLPDRGGPKDVSSATAEARRGLSDVFGGGEKGSMGGNGGTLSPEDRRFAAAEALRWAIVRASERARGRRVVLAVDDLHHVDGASRNAFADAIGEGPLVPALLVVTYVPGFDPGLPASAAARVLTGISVASVTRMFQEQGARGAPSLSGARSISPLYLDQLLRFTREQGSGAPSRLADIIALRVERLPADARRLLQAVAVLGDDATGETTLPLLPNEIDIVDALAVLTRAGMVEEEEGTLRTTHPLLREVVLATIPATVRRELHSAAGDVCERLGAPPEVLALHAYYASNAFQALILLERVSTLAASRGDLSGSILALRRGLELARRELVRGELDDPMRALLIFSRKLGEALAKAGQFTDAEGVLREALDMTGPSGEDRARVLGALAHVAHGRERRVEAQTYIREAIDLANRSGAQELVHSLEDLGRSNPGGLVSAAGDEREPRAAPDSADAAPAGSRRRARKPAVKEPEVRVRRIHRRDLNRVWDFLKLVFRAVNRETVEYQRPRTKKRFLEVYEETGVEQLLFEVGTGTKTDVVGYAECAIEIIGADNWINERYFVKRDMRPLFVEELAVHPDYQGRGVGAFILAQLEHLARVRGCTHLVLEVAENNKRALAFYRTRSFYKLDAAIFLAKKVANDADLLPPRALKPKQTPPAASSEPGVS